MNLNLLSQMPFHEINPIKVSLEDELGRRGIISIHQQVDWIDCPGMSCFVQGVYVDKEVDDSTAYEIEKPNGQKCWVGHHEVTWAGHDAKEVTKLSEMNLEELLEVKEIIAQHYSKYYQIYSMGQKVRTKTLKDRRSHSSNTEGVIIGERIEGLIRSYYIIRPQRKFLEEGRVIGWIRTPDIEVLLPSLKNYPPSVEKSGQ